MRVCTITCQNADNHGAKLQAYALAIYLTKQGHHVEIIDYRPSYLDFYVKLWFWPAFSLKQWARLFLQYRRRRTIINRHFVFEKFSRDFLPLTNRIYKTREELSSRPPQADIYIAGSDQIWNTFFQNGKDPVFYLDFGTEQAKRISYAASFATPKLQEDTENFVCSQLKRFDSISVRESSGLNILRELGFDGKKVVDPVFLLSANDWLNLTEDRKCDVGDYIVVYDFLNSPSIKRIANRLKLVYNCSIYSIGPRRLRYADKNFVYSSPMDFVGIIQGARCVLSNSFHGTAFAMIFQRNFFVVEREDGLNERMKDILMRYRLTDRLIDESVSDAVLTSNIDYINVRQQLDADVLSSKKYLKECLRECKN